MNQKARKWFVPHATLASLKKERPTLSLRGESGFPGLNIVVQRRFDDLGVHWTEANDWRDTFASILTEKGRIEYISLFFTIVQDYRNG